MYKLIKRQPLFLRLFHWLLVLLVVIIVPTGFYIHQPVQAIHVDFGRMFGIHVFAGFVLSYLMMARAYYAIFRGNYQTIVFTWRDVQELPALLSYYLFFRSEKPPLRKYNAGQRLIYTSWFVFLSLANISGAIAYKKTSFLPVAKLVGGMHHLDWATLLAALLLAYTVPLHIYLSLSENNNYQQAIFTGCSYELNPGVKGPAVLEQEKTRVKLPGLRFVAKLKNWFKIGVNP